jgi:hypothetical protein
MRVNGWQRIGIVASVLWAPIGAFWSLGKLYDPIYDSYRSCIGALTDWLWDFQRTRYGLYAEPSNRRNRSAPLPMRRFPPPWTVEAIDGGFEIVDANKQAIAYVYGHADQRDAGNRKLTDSR